ncbi:Acetyltransferase (GNAT) family [Musa troglodytarum]|uniref:Acetyltransferase (GNAT) family n=1 Tax=Musa troglodytarum TaxID=320322 RepID=A0A9E7KMK9_9LILI|nr:Acetyltransferase (GNAT) family [Musa troglodytarum]
MHQSLHKTQTAWFAQTCKCHLGRLWGPAVGGLDQEGGWLLGRRGGSSEGSFSKIAYLVIQVGSGWLPPDPSEGQVSICRGKLVVASERKKSLLLFSDVTCLLERNENFIYDEGLGPSFCNVVCTSNQNAIICIFRTAKACGFGEDCLGSTTMTYTQTATEFLTNNQAIQLGRMLLLVPPAESRVTSEIEFTET